MIQIDNLYYFIKRDNTNALHLMGYTVGLNNHLA